ncbi:hypothetical protein JEQ12_009340 [Ovis aries]|uniref:Uncharacterized protein n=1 Tax=Ovis aries TaxID=9940 RepID=A0A836AJJ5_SHEEP|nr:hypothetical protein JEQ12_009340 [Ovis aries]
MPPEDGSRYCLTDFMRLSIRCVDAYCDVTQDQPCHAFVMATTEAATAGILSALARGPGCEILDWNEKKMLLLLIPLLMALKGRAQEASDEVHCGYRPKFSNSTVLQAHELVNVQDGEFPWQDSKDDRLSEHGFGLITMDIREGQTSHYMEDYHEQYLDKNPDGFCDLGGTGVSCPWVFILDPEFTCRNPSPQHGYAF